MARITHHRIHPNLLKFLEPVREVYRQQIRELWGTPAVRPKMEMLRKLEAIRK